MALSTVQAPINPPRILTFGPEGIGKSSMGALAEKPIFLPTENGLGNLTHIPQFPQAKSYDDVMKFLHEVAFEEHDRKTLVIDSLDWLEPIMWKEICKRERVTHIEDACGGYAKWIPASLDLWRDYLEKLDYINQERQMTIIQIAHAQIRPYNGPDTQPYDRFSIKLHESKSGNGAAPLLFEWSDMVLFANWVVGITKDQLPGHSKKAPKERGRGVGSGERLLYTEERPAFKCKNRYGLPSEIDFDEEGTYWNVIVEHVPFYKQRKQETK